MLNWAYPDSLHVTSAVWKAQMEGRLAHDERPASHKALVGFRTTIEDLGQLRDALALTRDAREQVSLSVLLIGPVLWTRLSPSGSGIDLTPHIDGPEQGDVVLVTDEAVIAALVNGQVAPRTAVELGLMRLYGNAAAVDRAAKWIERIQPTIRDVERFGG